MLFFLPLLFRPPAGQETMSLQSRQRSGPGCSGIPHLQAGLRLYSPMPSKSEFKLFVRKWAKVQIPGYHRPSSFCNQNLFWLLSMLRLKTGAAWSFQSLGSKLHVITAAERGKEREGRGRRRDRKINLRTDTEGPGMKANRHCLAFSLQPCRRLQGGEILAARKTGMASGRNQVPPPAEWSGRSQLPRV